MNQQDSESSQPTLGPGDKLQTARISIGMTIEDVAAKMHLSSGILASLEDNQFEDITAPIFVKGYLRAYSRLVNLDEDEIIQQYSTYYMDRDPPISTTSKTHAELYSDDSKIKWVTYLIILGLIALLSTWWWNRYQQAPETVSLESDNNAPAQGLAFNSADAVVVKSLKSIVSADVETAENSLQREIKSVVDSMVQEQQQELSLQNIANTEMLSTVNEPQVSMPDTATIELEPEPEEPITVSPTIEPAINTNTKDLVITVTADTWASIRDANGKKLVYDLLKSGEIITVNGKAPFRAFLGNGHGVNMKYKGRDIDLSTVIRPDNTARIKIGQ